MRHIRLLFMFQRVDGVGLPENVFKMPLEHDLSYDQDKLYDLGSQFQLAGIHYHRR
jgi:hypothetical protein